MVIWRLFCFVYAGEGDEVGAGLVVVLLESWEEAPRSLSSELVYYYISIVLYR